ncbi:uncharacterized protein [Watersipora subatra]|uniref:uncharacterized protein n=1 Tax=Watersipora subatra TaxID=2589382 RepID=UPI00355C6F4E
MFGKSRSKSKANLALSKESVEVGHDAIGEGFVGSRELIFSQSLPIHSRPAGFSAHYLGVVSRFMMQTTSSDRKSPESQLIAKIEEEQLDGKLRLKPLASDAVTLRLDRHGFKITKQDGEDIILRVPLHTLAQLVMYDDGFSKSNLAVKVIVGKDLFSCHVFQCVSDDVAMGICDALQRVFRVIMSESDAAM